MNKEQYHKYLLTEKWKKTSEYRKKIDGYKCQVCGRPLDLQVHHTTYKHVPYERLPDLITLCANCHQRVEKMKRHPGQDSYIEVNILIARQFCEDFAERDYSRMGDLDLCNRDVVLDWFLPYLKSHSGYLEWDYIRLSNIQEYFRNRRYEVILKYMENDAPPYIVKQQTKFNPAMIDKVYHKPEQAKRLLEEEKS